MPTYEYACRSCGEHLEAVQSFSDPPLTKCPRCGGELRKVFGNIGIVFKGSGFYKTDNRTSGRNGSSSKEHAGHGAKSEASSNGSSGSEGGSAQSGAKEPSSTKESSSAKESPASNGSASSSASERSKATSAKTTTAGAA
jgi:putative FmdB family regulatory protein